MFATYNNLGLLHSFNDKPSLINENGDIFWHHNNLLHRNHLPAKIYIKKQFVIWEWWNYGILTRNNGPALIKIKDGIIHSEIYYKNNLFHRENGPAIIEYNYEGEIIKSSYYNNGYEVPIFNLENSQPLFF